MPNPIPAQVTDGKKLQEIFKELPLIPYSSNSAGTGHRLLQFFEDMTRLSVTNGGVIKSKLDHAFGGDAYVERLVSEAFGEYVYEQASDTEMNALNEVVRSRVFMDDNYRNVSRRLGAQLQANGNMAVKTTIVKTEGGEAIRIEVIETKRFLYTSAYEGMTAVAIFDTMPKTKQEWKKAMADNRIEIVPVFPNYRELDNGDRVTFRHYATTDEWYGRPPWEHCWMDCYREFQDRIHLIKESDSEWVGRVIIEVEDPKMPNAGALLDDQRDIEAGYSGTADRMAKNFTRESDNPQSFMITNRPSEARPMTVTKIEPMSNEGFWKTASEISRDSIIFAHEWSRRLMGQEFSSGFSRDAFIEELLIKDATVIKPFRGIVADFLGSILSHFLDENGFSEASRLRINFMSPHKKMIDEWSNNSDGGSI